LNCRDGGPAFFELKGLLHQLWFQIQVKHLQPTSISFEEPEDGIRHQSHWRQLRLAYQEGVVVKSSTERQRMIVKGTLLSIKS